MLKKKNEKIMLVYNYIDRFIKANGYSPSYREISAGVKIKSIADVKAYLEYLRYWARISYKDSVSRTIRIIADLDYKDIDDIYKRER